MYKLFCLVLLLFGFCVAQDQSGADAGAQEADSEMVKLDEEMRANIKEHLHEIALNTKRLERGIAFLRSSDVAGIELGGEEIEQFIADTDRQLETITLFSSMVSEDLEVIEGKTTPTIEDCEHVQRLGKYAGVAANSAQLLVDNMLLMVKKIDLMVEKVELLKIYKNLAL